MVDVMNPLNVIVIWLWMIQSEANMRDHIVIFLYVVMTASMENVLSQILVNAKEDGQVLPVINVSNYLDVSMVTVMECPVHAAVMKVGLGPCVLNQFVGQDATQKMLFVQGLENVFATMDGQERLVINAFHIGIVQMKVQALVYFRMNVSVC